MSGYVTSVQYCAKALAIPVTGSKGRDRLGISNWLKNAQCLSGDF